MSDYTGREQTQAKHFILRGYLQELAYKVLNNWDIAYVDGFSGPWESKAADFSDTSFMVALKVLKEAQKNILERTHKRRTIRCFFSEKNAGAYQQMVKTVMPFHHPGESFEVKTFHGEFVDAVGEIRAFVGNAFRLIFIDPTGWTGYPFTKIAPLFAYEKCEVLINFMYDYINRFRTHSDEKIIGSLDPILGGPGWQRRLDPALEKGPAVEKLFRKTLMDAGKFRYVVSTRIDKSTAERPHFFLAYGTKNRAGLKAFREIEYKALREHAKNRSVAMTRKRDGRENTASFLIDFEAAQKEASIDDLVAEQKALAKGALVKMLPNYPHGLSFNRIVDVMLQAFMLRETNVKDVCVDLAKVGEIANTWGSGSRKPTDDTVIKRLPSV